MFSLTDCFCWVRDFAASDGSPATTPHMPLLSHLLEKSGSSAAAPVEIKHTRKLYKYGSSTVYLFSFLFSLLFT